MSFQYLSDHQGIDQDFSPRSIYFARQDMKQKMFSEELNIKSTTPGRYKWLFGAFGFWQGIDNTVTLDYFTKDYATRKLYDTPAYGVAFADHAAMPVRSVFAQAYVCDDHQFRPVLLEHAHGLLDNAVFRVGSAAQGC